MHFSKKKCKFVPEIRNNRALVAKNKCIFMARPIKETPTLYGEDARRFAYAIEHPQAVSHDSVMHAQAVYESVMQNATFRF